MRRQVEYSEKYFDDEFEYRHVIMPREMGSDLKKMGLLSEDQWRELGITQSKGWIHYDSHPPEPHILIFKRPLGTDPRTGLVNNQERDIIKQEAEFKRRAARAMYK